MQRFNCLSDFLEFRFINCEFARPARYTEVVFWAAIGSDLTPHAFLAVPPILVSGIGGAFDRVLFQVLQSHQPFTCLWACSLFAAQRPKRDKNSSPTLGGMSSNVGVYGGGAMPHVLARGPCAKRNSFDEFFKRRITGTVVNTRVGVAPHEQQLVEQNGQSESVVILRSCQSSQRFPLQLRGM